MNFTFVAVVVALTGLLGLAFALFGVLHSRSWGGGKPGKRQSNGLLRMGLLLRRVNPSSIAALPQPPVSTLLTSHETSTAGHIHSIQSSTSSTNVSVENADLALLDHRALLGDFPSNYSELLAVSGHQEEIVTTQDPVKTQTWLSGLFCPSWKCFSLSDRGMVC